MQDIKKKSEATIKSDIDVQRENLQKRLAQRKNKKNAGRMGMKSSSTANILQGTTSAAPVNDQQGKINHDVNSRPVDDNTKKPSSPLFQEEVQKTLQPSMSMAPSV